MTRNRSAGVDTVRPQDGVEAAPQQDEATPTPPQQDGVGTSTSSKDVVRRLVDEVMNGADLDALDDLCTPRLAPKLRLAFTQFRTAFPDWRQEVLELVAEGGTVVARFRCTGTHLAPWQGLPPTGRAMRVDEVYFFRLVDGRIAGLWGLEDTWTRMRQLAGDEATVGELGSLS